MGRRVGKNSSSARLQLGYSGLAITDECSLAGVVRAHVQAKEQKLPLVIGSYFKLVHADKRPAFGLILLAQNREGYGNLSELITLGRMRAPKGSYLLTPQDIARPEKEHAHLRGVPDCLAILIPDFPAKEEALAAQLEWMNATFPARAWVGLTLHQRAMDDIHRGTVEYLASRYLVPVVATGNVVMHVRSRKPLQDTMTAIRIGKPVAQCGYDLAPNAEQHLRSRLRLANLYPEHALAETLSVLERCNFSLDELRYEYPDELVPARLYTRGLSAAGNVYRRPSAISERHPAHGAGTDRARTEADRANSNTKPYFLTVYRHRALRPQPAHSLSGTRLGCQLRGLLLPGRH